MFEAYLWKNRVLAMLRTTPLRFWKYSRNSVKMGSGDLFFDCGSEKESLLPGQYAEVPHLLFVGDYDVEFQQDPAEHIKVQYHDEELTLRQLIDKLDEKTFECTRLKNIATAQKDEIIMLKRDLSAMEERLDG